MTGTPTPRPPRRLERGDGFVARTATAADLPQMLEVLQGTFPTWPPVPSDRSALEYLETTGDDEAWRGWLAEACVKIGEAYRTGTHAVAHDIGTDENEDQAENAGIGQRDDRWRNDRQVHDILRIGIGLRTVEHFQDG